VRDKFTIFFNVYKNNIVIDPIFLFKVYKNNAAIHQLIQRVFTGKVIGFRMIGFRKREETNFIQ